MYITSKTLADILQKWNPRVYGEKNVFYFNRILPPGRTEWKNGESPLVLLQEEDYLPIRYNTSSYSAPAACIVAGKWDLENGCEVTGTVVIFLDSNVSLEQEVFPALMQYYCEKNDVLALHKNHLLRLMSSGCDLQSLLIEATQILDNPFIVYDSHYALVAHSVSKSLPVPQAQSVVKNGYANVDVISQMEKDGSLNYVFSHQQHPNLVKIINGYEKLAVSIYNGENYVGLLCFFNYVRPISEDDYELVRFLGELTKIYFQNQLSQGCSWTPWDYLFSATLCQKHIFADDELTQLGLKLPGKMCLMVIAAPGALHSPQADQLKYLQTWLLRMLPACHLYLHGEYLLCLDSTGNFHNFHSVHLSAFIQELDRLDMVCGMSNPFYKVDSLYTAFVQAETAIVLDFKAGPHSRIRDYSQITISHMLSLLGKNYPLESFCHPVLARLEQYDNEYHTNYLEFFLVYLLCGQNSRLCAECFGIHYNSVKYRLNVIQDTGSFDLKDVNTAVLLYLSCRIYMDRNPGFLDKYHLFFRHHPEIVF